MERTERTKAISLQNKNLLFAYAPKRLKILLEKDFSCVLLCKGTYRKANKSYK